MRHLKKKLEPDSNFIKGAKAQYLSFFESKFPTARNERHVFIYAFRGVSAFAAILLILGATSSYAYQKNVEPENFLYPLKISQEKIILSLTGAQEKPIAHLKLAEKRFDELQKLKIKNPESKKIAKLAENMSEELKHSSRVFEIQIKTMTASENNTQTQELEKQNQTNKDLSKKQETGVKNDDSVNNKDNEEGEDNEKTKSENKSLMSVPPTPGSEKIKDNSDNKETERSLEKKQQETDKTDPKILLEKLIKQQKACKIYEKLIKNNLPEIEKELQEHPDIIKNFEDGCDVFDK